MRTVLSPQQALETKPVLEEVGASLAREMGTKLRERRHEHNITVDVAARLLRKTVREIVNLEHGWIAFINTEVAMEVVVNRYETIPRARK